MHKEKDHAKHVQIELLVTPVPNLPVPQVLVKGSAQKKPQHAGCVRMGSFTANVLFHLELVDICIELYQSMIMHCIF